ncbi:unnamed protein product [Arabis nemorensis]|uniref:Uncharacterized protein n=1 Tax=Arabis nemorensis TaxID=586526 RepID=A0A565B1D7_9BRAS|nr:unnamed protein product [Arabis nemorensis]
MASDGGDGRSVSGGLGGSGGSGGRPEFSVARSFTADVGREENATIVLALGTLDHLETAERRVSLTAIILAEKGG